MHIVSKKHSLLESLQTTVVSQKSLIPILANVLLEAGDNTLTVISTDLDISIRCKIEVDVIKEGSITLPLKKLLDIVREMPEDDISIEVNDNYYTSITSGKSFFSIVGLSSNDYPDIPDVKEGYCFSILSSILKKMIKRIVFAAAIDDNRRVLNGGCLITKGSEVRIVATDGFVLSLAKYRLLEDVSQEISVILPNKTLSEIMRLLRDEAMVDVYLYNNQIILAFDDIIFMSRLIDGNYIDYESFIPTITSNNVLHIKSAVLFNTCRRIGIMASEDVNIFELSIFDSVIKISSFTPGIGEATENIIDVDYKGEDFSVRYNSKHTINVLRNIDVEEIDMLFIGDLKAGVIIVNNDKEEYFYFIVPIVDR